MRDIWRSVRRPLRRFWYQVVVRSIVRGYRQAEKPIRKRQRAKEKEARREHGVLTCQAKRPFRSRDEAWSYAMNVNRIKGWNLSPYKCRYCPFFHLTSKNPVQPPKEYWNEKTRTGV